MSMIICNNINYEYIKLIKKGFKNYRFFEWSKYIETKINEKFKNIYFKSIVENSNHKKGKRIQTRSKIETFYNNEKSFNNYKKINFFNIINNLTIIILFIFYNIHKVYSSSLIDFYSSIITIRINETGVQNLFFDKLSNQWHQKVGIFDIPDEVIINNETQKNNSFQYNFSKTENIIQFIWHEPRENWGCLFKDCINIIEVDFSQFNFS